MSRAKQAIAERSSGAPGGVSTCGYDHKMPDWDEMVAMICEECGESD